MSQVKIILKKNNNQPTVPQKAVPSNYTLLIGFWYLFLNVEGPYTEQTKIFVIGNKK